MLTPEPVWVHGSQNQYTADWSVVLHKHIQNIQLDALSPRAEKPYSSPVNSMLTIFLHSGPTGQTEEIQ